MPQQEKDILLQQIFKIHRTEQATQRETSIQFDDLAPAAKDAIHQRWLNLDAAQRTQWRKKTSLH